MVAARGASGSLVCVYSGTQDHCLRLLFVAFLKRSLLCIVCDLCLGACLTDQHQALCKRNNRCSPRTTILKKIMPRYVTVLSDSESEDNEGHNDDDKDRNEDDQNEEDDEDDRDDPRVHQLRPLVEAYEFAIRNVQICGEYLEFASAQHERLQSMSAVLFEQAMSPRWSVAFIGVLKRSRALRIRTLFGDNDKDAVSTGGCCLACGAKEQHCMEALELAGDDGDINDCAFTNLADRIDGLDMRDLSTPASKFGPYYYGVFAGGVKCLDLATAAVLARNLVLDTCVDLRNALDQVHERRNRRGATRARRARHQPTDRTAHRLPRRCAAAGDAHSHNRGRAAWTTVPSRSQPAAHGTSRGVATARRALATEVHHPRGGHAVCGRARACVGGAVRHTGHARPAPSAATSQRGGFGPTRQRAHAWRRRAARGARVLAHAAARLSRVGVGLVCVQQC